MSEPRFDTVVDLLDHAFEHHADRPAYTCLDSTLTFNQIDQLSAKFASYIQHHTSLKPGDRIAIQLPNISQYPVVLYGAIRAGLVVVNTNPLYTSREIEHQLTDSGAKALVILANVAAEASEVIENTAVEHVIVTELGDLFPWPKRSIVNFVVKYIKKMVPAYHFKASTAFNTALAKGSQPYTPVPAKSSDLLALQYTGGTTGVAKGAMLSHANLCVNIEQTLTHLYPLLSEPDQEVAAALPLYHIFAFNLHALAAFSRGAHNILIPNPRDLASFVKAVKNRKITLYIAVNTLFNALARNEAFKQLDFSALMVSAAGGMAVNDGVARLWHEVTGCEICEGYGLTETSPVICANVPSDIRKGSIGKPVPNTEVRLLNSEEVDVPEGEAGELCVRGPQVMQGYWQREEATTNSFTKDGFFKTGDIAVKNPEGNYKIVDRKKDMILVSGFNVYPNEVEDVVMLCKGVVEAAVVGVPHDTSGELVKLFVVVSDESITKEKLIAHCRESLTAYKVPKLVEFRKELPKTNVGKILRRALRDESV